MKTYIYIPETGTYYATDTAEEIEYARDALIQLGIESAPIWAGDPEQGSDCYKNGQLLFALS